MGAGTRSIKIKNGLFGSVAAANLSPQDSTRQTHGAKDDKIMIEKARNRINKSVRRHSINTFTDAVQQKDRYNKSRGASSALGN